MADNGFSKWQEYILQELKRLGEVIDKFDGKLDKINVAIAVLRVKSGIWGAIAGLIPAIIYSLYAVIIDAYFFIYFL